MQVAKLAALGLALFACTAVATERPFTAVMNGSGRACAGDLVVRSQSIAWSSSFSRCKSSPYEVIDQAPAGDARRRVYLLKKPSKGCFYPVVELAQVRDGAWNVSGYQSLASYRNRELPEWRNSPIESRMVLSCPMFEGAR